MNWWDLSFAWGLGVLTAALVAAPVVWRLLPPEARMPAPAGQPGDGQEPQDEAAPDEAAPDEAAADKEPEVPLTGDEGAGQ